MNHRNSKFIVFEGIDGSGKTTLSRMLLSDFKTAGIDTVWFREPSDSPWGKKIRDLAHSADSIPIEEELSYFMEDRKWDINHNILPALTKGRTVILDRYFFSTACYQGARGLDMTEIIAANTAFAPKPDITFIIDVDVDVAMKRIKDNREQEAKLFEKREFLQKVKANYLMLADKNIHIIDGNDSLDAVFALIKDYFPQTNF